MYALSGTPRGTRIVPLKVIRSVKFRPVICGSTVMLPLTGLAEGGLLVVLLGGGVGGVVAESVGTVAGGLLVVSVAVLVGFVAGGALVGFVVGGPVTTV